MDQLEFIWIIIEVWILPVIIIGGVSLFILLLLWQIISIAIDQYKNL
mgnify:CR=1 FL=1|jgi:hypothetical protein